MLTAERLRELLHFDPLTGVFTWRVRPAQRMKVGEKAGGMNAGGYAQISIGGTIYYAHRLAWLYIHGTWPPDQIDHINGVRHANMISNLRLANNSENHQNRHGLRTDNASGATGVDWITKDQKWRARININGKEKYLGLFDTKEDAIEYRELAQAMVHPFRAGASP